MIHVGLGKTLFHSSAASIAGGDGGLPEVTLALTERLLRKKASGAWPERAIQALGVPHAEFISENGDVNRPAVREEGLNRAFPFYDHLRFAGLGRYSSALNANVEFVSHHRCHAMAALLHSPFEKCMVVVMDGAGTRAADFPRESKERKSAPSADAHEECTAYLFDFARRGFDLECVSKRWRRFEGELSEGAGIFYESIAAHIFGSTRAAGKVMGLAPYGRAQTLSGTRIDFLKRLNPAHAFRGVTNREWEAHPHQQEFRDLAATAQSLFEDDFGRVLRELRARFPEHGNIILTGGCALNCSFNGKLVREGLFDSVYVPPYPGDESIGLGAAADSFLRESVKEWRPVPMERQHGYFGPAASQPFEARVREVFAGFQIEKPESITHYAADRLAEGQVVAWFQGRSESGPRALGNRSLLARPDRRGIKDFLNSRIKFRESFRPYGASCAFDRAHEYFEVPEGFHTPFMSFAVQTRAHERERLHEVTHADGTCRFQSVRPGQNQRFLNLIQNFGARTGLYCLLNTSLNVMGEPIVETLEDARGFLLKMNEGGNSPVDGLAAGDFYIRAVKS